MAKRCQIGLKIQIAESQLKVTKYFGQQERWFIQGRDGAGRGKPHFSVKMAVLASRQS